MGNSVTVRHPWRTRAILYVDGNRLRDGLYRRETRLVRGNRSAVAEVRIDRTLQDTVDGKVKVAGSTGGSERAGGKS